MPQPGGSALGGLLEACASSARVAAFHLDGADSCRSVMSIGGFDGNDPAPTLEQLRRVGRVHS